MELLINGTSHEIDDPKELHVELERVRQSPFADVRLLTCSELASDLRADQCRSHLAYVFAL